VQKCSPIQKSEYNEERNVESEGKCKKLRIRELANEQ